MHLAIGKILNKEQKAKDQIRDLENQLLTRWTRYQTKIGKNKTFTVMEIHQNNYPFSVKISVEVHRLSTKNISFLSRKVPKMA